MALVTMKEILIEARKKGYAVGAFEFWSQESAYVIAEAARCHGVPAILQAGKMEAEFVGGYDNLYHFAEKASADTGVPIALHLDHGESMEVIKDAINAGFTSVMMDASQYEYSKNVELTCQVVELAHKAGVSTEAELGVLAGVEGNITRADAEALQTDPGEAARFVRDTGVDALAVAIGTVHGFYTFTPEINIKRLAEIEKAVSIPLVLHGGSNTPEDKVQEAISHGIAKVNICTEFVAAYGRGYTRIQQTPGFKYSIPNLFGGGRAAGYELASHKIGLFKNK